MRTLTLSFAAVAGLALLSQQAVAAESATTRIEPRPYYGAVVTVEKGVRVYRPLPPHDHIIINPTNAPIYLGINDRPVQGNPYADPGASLVIEKFVGAWPRHAPVMSFVAALAPATKM